MEKLKVLWSLLKANQYFVATDNRYDETASLYVKLEQSDRGKTESGKDFVKRKLDMFVDQIDD
jgi:hypothetical protein